MVRCEWGTEAGTEHRELSPASSALPSTLTSPPPLARSAQASGGKRESGEGASPRQSVFIKFETDRQRIWERLSTPAFPPAPVLRAEERRGATKRARLPGLGDPPATRHPHGRPVGSALQYQSAESEDGISE